ncbi:MAG: hypothetical protein K6T29_09450 [Peptococcaceae bacterium]|nr:hypothetical protein [Peptococcaceae bacterium]
MVRLGVGYLRLLKAVIEDLVEHYAEVYKKALEREYLLLYLSEAIEKLKRQGYDAGPLEKVRAELSEDVYVEDLDCFFESCLFRVACEVMGWEPAAKERQIKNLARGKVSLAEVKELAWRQVRQLYFRLLSGAGPPRGCPR